MASNNRWPSTTASPFSKRPHPPRPAKPARTSDEPKPKPTPSRRSSRPPSVHTALPAAAPADTDAPPPPSPRPANTRRRRRSQAGKAPPAPGPARAHPPAPPAKDTPPHLALPPPRTDTHMRTDIALLVERVRASAMEAHRPSTPGSHIDWAGDDDDSLPDLDDWGVSVGHSHNDDPDKEAVISPIILDGLRPLPELAHEDPDSSSSPSQETPPSEPSPPQLPAPEPKPIRAPLPLHPSLPAKPVHALAAPAPKPGFGATPMRPKPHPKPAEHSTDPNPPAHADTVTPAPSQPQPAQDPIPNATPIPQISTPAPQPVLPSPPRSTDPLDAFIASSGLGASIHAPRPEPLSAPPTVSAYTHAQSSRPSSAQPKSPRTHPHPHPPSPHLYPPGHASPQIRPHSVASHGTHTHTRAHTTGRPASLPKHPHPHAERPGRAGARGGGANNNNGGPGSALPAGTPVHNNRERGPLSPYSQGHARTHSTPPPGTPHSAHGRPVLTGAALSRLARTIGPSAANGGGSGGTSPGKPQTQTQGQAVPPLGN